MNAAAKLTTAPKAPEARQEPRQHATCNKSNQQKSFVYVVEDKNPPPGSTVVVREKGWNVWENDEKRIPLRRLQLRILARLSQTYGAATISLRRTIRGTAGIWSTPSSHLTKTEQPTSSFPSLGRTTPRAGARTKRRKLIKIKTRPEPDPNAQKMTNQRSRTKTRAKRKLKKSNLVTIDASKLSSLDQVPPRMKKRTEKAAFRTNLPTSDQVKRHTGRVK